jgi:hypothetical protein
MGLLDDGISDNAVDDDATAAYDVFEDTSNPTHKHFFKYSNTYIM